MLAGFGNLVYHGSLRIHAVGPLREGSASVVWTSTSEAGKRTDTVGEFGRQAANAAKREVRVAASGRLASHAARRLRA